MAKGQAEIVIIAAFVIIGVVVILFAFPSIIRSSLTPVTEEQKSVRQSVENFLKQASTVNLREVSFNGGFYPPSAQKEYENFNGRPVYYWLPNSKPDDIKASLRRAIGDYIKASKDRLAASLADKNVTFGDVEQIELDLSESMLSLKVSMPTKMKGFDIPQPYSIQVPTKTKEAFDLAQQLSGFQYGSRFFENATIITTFSTSYVEGVHQVPLDIFWGKCDRPYAKDYEEMAFWTKDVISRTMKGTYMPDKAPQDVKDSSGLFKHLLPAFSGKKYTDLEVDFFLPPDFSLNRDNFHFMTSKGQADYILLEAKQLDGVCVPVSAAVSYTLSYPVTVSIRDPFTENRFLFALKIAIADNLPSKALNAAGYEAGGQYEHCNRMSCDGSIFVLDKESGKGVPNAYITYGGCYLGQTSEKGIFEGKIPCLVAGTLDVSAAEYERYTNTAGASELKGYNLRISGVKQRKVYVHKVEVKNDTASKSYVISKSYISYNQGNVASINFIKVGGEPKELKTDRLLASISMPSGLYMIFGGIYSKDMKVQYGAFAESAFEVKQDTTELHVYFPLYEQTDTAVQESAARARLYSRILEKCGIGPVSLSDAPKDCTVKYEGVG